MPRAKTVKAKSDPPPHITRHSAIIDVLTVARYFPREIAALIADIDQITRAEQARLQRHEEERERFERALQAYKWYQDDEEEEEEDEEHEDIPAKRRRS